MAFFFFFITKRTLGKSSERLSLANSGSGAPKWFFSILIYLDMQYVVIANVSLNYYRWNRTQDSSLICPLFKWSLKISFFSLELCNFTETYLHMSYSFLPAHLECLKCIALCLMMIWDAKSLCFSKLPQSHFAFCAFCELWIDLCTPFQSVLRPLSFFST